jgi:hypothetical protein
VTQLYVRFCFPNASAADAFRVRFGGERLTYTRAKPRSRTPTRKSSDGTPAWRQRRP